MKLRYQFQVGDPVMDARDPSSIGRLEAMPSDDCWVVYWHTKSLRALVVPEDLRPIDETTVGTILAD